MMGSIQIMYILEVLRITNVCRAKIDKELEVKSRVLISYIDIAKN